MVNVKFFNEAVSVTTLIDSQGYITLQSLTWQNKLYSVTAIGRQWDEADGRHILAETADGTRFELQLCRENLIWHVRKVWQEQWTA